MSKKKNKTKENKLSDKPKHIEVETKSKLMDKKWIYALVSCVLITFGVFFNTLDNEFVNWDDDKNFYENEQITSLNEDNFWKNTIEIFKTPVIGNYNPLSIWTFLVNNKFHGLDDPTGWHATNLFFHLLAVFFLFLIGKRFGLNMGANVFFTLLFAIHPMRVESVAWVTERKDVLFGSFFLIALWQYLRYRQDNNKTAIMWIYIFFILSLLSKIQAVTLPLVFICVDYWLDKKITAKSIFNKWPYLILSLLIGLLGIYFLVDQGSIQSTENTFAIWQRLFVGSFSYCVYLIKSIFPYEMAALYPYPAEMPWYFYVSMGILPIVLGLLIWAYNNGKHAIVFGIGFFTFNIVFLLQILGAGQGFIADRFSYISYIGLNFVYAWYGQRLLMQPKFRNLALGLGLALIVMYSYITIRQNEVWQNSDTMWSNVIDSYKNARTPFGNRANYYRKVGRLQEAMADYNRAIELGEAAGVKADLAQTYNSRARLYFDHAKGRDSLMLALNDYNRAIELKPGDGEFHTNRGATHARLGDIDKALEDMSLGVQYKPDHAVAYMNRSLMYNMKGQYDLALNDLTTYLQLNPYNADIWYEKGRLLQLKGRYQESIEPYSTAIRYNSNKGLYYYGRSKSYAALNRINEAKSDAQNAINLGTQVDADLRGRVGL